MKHNTSGNCVNERKIIDGTLYSSSIIVTIFSGVGILFSLLIQPLVWPVIVFSLLIRPLAWIAKGTFQAAEDSEEHESCSSNLHFGIVLNNIIHYASFPQASAFIV